MTTKKIIILTLMLCLLTGCSVKENIVIHKDLSVMEEVNMSGTKEFFDNRYKMLPINVIKDILQSENREIILKQNGYSYDIDTSDKYPSVIAKKDYSDLSTFTNQTIFKDQYFKSFSTKEEDNLVTITATDYIKYEQGDLERYPISACQINIQLPFVATDNNADKYTAKTNTYTWYINADTESKEIHLTFDKTRIYIYNLVFYISIGIVIILIGIGIGFILKWKKKNGLNNRI